MSEYRLYRPRRSYTLMAYGGVLVALLFAWEVGRNFAWPTLFFFVIALAFAAVNLRSATTQVELTPTGLTCHRRFAVSPLHIDFRQIVTVTQAGHMTTGISLIYYPLAANGLIDLDDPRSLFLPAMERQDELLAIVQRGIVE
ncbi:MAG: hypothetical protein HY328_00510 [Chloroflexi bacterium]|nr:hypothetical protein [Chloroflexota bacterium]